MTKEGINRRLKLRLPLVLLESLEQELNFLGVGERTIASEDGSVSNRSDFIKLVVEKYVHRRMEGFGDAIEELEGEKGDLNFFLGRDIEGLWNVATKVDHIAANYHQLVHHALLDYFYRAQDRAGILAQQIELYKPKLQNFEVGEWRELLL